MVGGGLHALSGAGAWGAGGVAGGVPLQPWVRSSVVEHSAAVRMVPGSNPGVPSLCCVPSAGDQNSPTRIRTAVAGFRVLSANHYTMGDCLQQNGDAGYRSLYLSHAERALYHLSYTPTVRKTQTAGFEPAHAEHTRLADEPRNHLSTSATAAVTAKATVV